MWVECLVCVDFVFQFEFFVVGWQQQFDCGCVEVDFVVQVFDFVWFVDVFDCEYCGQDLCFGDCGWIVCEQWFDVEWLVGFDDEMYVIVWDVDVWYFVDDVVDLCDYDVVFEGGGFDDGWCVFGVWVGVQVVVVIGVYGGD